MSVSWNLQDKPPEKRLLGVKLGGLVGEALALAVRGCGFKSGGGGEEKEEEEGEWG